MSPFEMGYAALMQGKKREDNPFDKDSSPYYNKRWDAGWVKSREEHSK